MSDERITLLEAALEAAEEENRQLRQALEAALEGLEHWVPTEDIAKEIRTALAALDTPAESE